MKQSSTRFLQAVIVLFGAAALAFMLWEPHVEGRNADATLFEIYFKDPFLAYAYLSSIPFFVALGKAFRLLGYAGRNNAFSNEAVRALQAIKRCALIIVGLVAAGEVYILFSDSDDRAGGVFMGLLIIACSVVTAVFATVFGRILQDGMELKGENEHLLRQGGQSKDPTSPHDAAKA